MSDINFEIVKHIKAHGHAPSTSGLMTVSVNASKAERDADYAKKRVLAKSLNKEECIKGGVI